MAGGNSEKTVKKMEEGSLQKFKNQNRMLKKFGKDGLRVYKAVFKKGTTVSAIAEKTGLAKARINEILDFMRDGGMAEYEGDEKAAPPKAPEAKGRLPAPRPPEEEGEPAEEPLEEKPEEEEAPEEEAPGPEEIPEAPKKPKRKGLIVPIGEEGQELGRKKPEEEPEEEKPGEEEAPAAEEAEEAPEEEEPAGEEAPKEEGPAEEAAEKEAPEEGEPEEVSVEEEEEEVPEEVEEEEPEEEEESGELTPSELMIQKKYGNVGIKVYNLIDGQRTAEEIMEETGITESELIEMLDFMEKEGIIRLEHPEKKRGAVTEEKRSLFAPLVEEESKLEQPISKLEGHGVDVPSKVKANIFSEIQLKAKIMVKLGKKGVEAYELMDGKNDVVDIAYKSGVPLYFVYTLIDLLKKVQAVELKPMSRDQIRAKYGEDGYSVYKKYGRDGVMLYQLIGKELNLKQMAELTSMDNEKVVEMFMFIHKLLGIDLPIDADILYQRLGVEKKKKEEP